MNLLYPQIWRFISRGTASHPWCQPQRHSERFPPTWANAQHHRGNYCLTVLYRHVHTVVCKILKINWALSFAGLLFSTCTEGNRPFLTIHGKWIQHKGMWLDYCSSAGLTVTCLPTNNKLASGRNDMRTLMSFFWCLLQACLFYFTNFYICHITGSWLMSVRAWFNGFASQLK